MPGFQSKLFYDIGTDRPTYDFTVYTSSDQDAITDITGWTLSFLVKRRPTDADVDALVTKTTAAGIVISGVFNASPAINTQKATVTMVDTETDAIAAATYYWELKRMDAGSEQRIGYGRIAFNQTVHRS